MAIWNGLFNPIKWVERLTNGTFFYTLWEGTASWTKHTSDQQKIKAILENPAALYIFLLLCELFSMGKYKMTLNDEEVEQDPLLQLLRNPNPLQTGTQFKYDYMLMRKLGTANMYIDSKIVSERNKLYFLHADCIEWPRRMTNHSMDLILSDSGYRDLKREVLTYRTLSQTLKFPYEKLVQFFDISNGISGFFSSPSRVDALYKIISNSDNALKSKNINTSFTSKFLVSGTVGVTDTSKLPMGEKDKESVEAAMTGKRSIYTTKTQTAINRFIENASVLEHLDKAWMNDAFVIGKMLNIPKDVIEMLGDGATYENQEKARAMIISYCIQPDADDFCDGMLRYFNYGPQYKLTIDYSHLPFVQALERDRAEMFEKKANAFMRMVSAGADQQQAADILGLELNKFNAPVRLLGSETEPMKLTKVV